MENGVLFAQPGKEPGIGKQFPGKMVVFPFDPSGFIVLAVTIIIPGAGIAKLISAEKKGDALDRKSVV